MSSVPTRGCIGLCSPGWGTGQATNVARQQQQQQQRPLPDQVPFSVDFYSMGVVYWEALGNHIVLHHSDKKEASKEDKKNDASELENSVDQVLKEKEKEKAANLETYSFISKLVNERPSHQDIRALEFFSRAVQDEHHRSMLG